MGLTQIRGQVQLQASDGVVNDHFGSAVSISGDYAIFGALAKNSYRGAAYVYHRSGGNNWTDEVIITASNGVDNDQLGISVSISGDYAVIGAYGKNSSGGAVYAYHRSGGNNWTDEVIITASDGADGDHFGYSVSISGDYAIVGAYNKDSQRGAVYVYHRSGGNNWTDEVIIIASDSSDNDHFGSAVSICGDYAIIGVRGKNSSRGAVYVYHRSGGNNWTDQVIITASNGADGDYFGNSVSMSGDYAIIGAPHKNSNRGAVYVYHRSGGNNWTDEAIITASDGVGSDHFGFSVSVSGDHAIVGAWAKDSNRGGVYVYHRSGGNSWGDEAIITASDGAADDFLGIAASISGGYAIVSAYGKNAYRGAVYVYHNCSLGYTNNGTDCEPCEAGTSTYSVFASVCASCLEGSYCPEESPVPTLCSIGTYSNETNRTTDCPPCPAGSFCENPASIATCSLSQWCPEGSTNQSTLCPVGYYCHAGDTSPRPCTLGTYCGSEGRSTDGAACADGFYCPTVTQQLQCPAGSRCPSGTVTPVACVTSGYYCPSGSANAIQCTPGCPANAPHVVAECSSSKDLECSAATVLDNRSFEVPWLLLGVAVAALCGVLIASKTLKRYHPHSHPMRMFAFVFATVDLVSDIVFIVHIHGVVPWAFRAALAVFVVCVVLQGAYIARITAIWMNRGEFRDYVLDRPLWFALVWVVSATNIESLLVLSSRVFHLDMCSAPLTRQQEHRIMSVGGVGVVFESIPQFIIQLLVALELKELSGPVGFALLITVIQLVISISKYAWLCVAGRKGGHSSFAVHGTEMSLSNNDDDGERLLSRVMASDDPVACVRSLKDTTEMRRLMSSAVAGMCTDDLQTMLELAITKLCEQESKTHARAAPSVGSAGRLGGVASGHRQSIMAISMDEGKEDGSPDGRTGVGQVGLPSGWCKYVSDTGVPYYFNQSMGVTQWEPPQ